MTKKIILAYSGGLDTSVILVWLKEKYNYDVIAFLADLGQEENLKKAADKALALGAVDVVIEDIKTQFVSEYVYPMLRANTLYEGRYLLGTAIARPLIAKAQIECARQKHANALCHGATGKGNDQIRFELAYAALAPELEVIAPWRIWDMQSRSQLIKYANKHQIPIEEKPADSPPFSMDANLLHRSSEGNALEDLKNAAPENAFSVTKSPLKAQSESETIEITFAGGDAVALNSDKLKPDEMLKALNVLGGKHGIGRVDMIENRSTGMKSRGVYETPGGTILLAAHRFLEELVLDGEAAFLKESLMPLYARLIYRGLWFAPEREMLQALIDKSQIHIEGKVKLELYRGNIMPLMRQSDKSLYDEAQASFEDESEAYDHKDAEGFIRINALRLKKLHKQKIKR